MNACWLGNLVCFSTYSSNMITYRKSYCNSPKNGLLLKHRTYAKRICLTCFFCCFVFFSSFCSLRVSCMTVHISTVFDYFTVWVFLLNFVICYCVPASRSTFKQQWNLTWIDIWSTGTLCFKVALLHNHYNKDGSHFPAIIWQHHHISDPPSIICSQAAQSSNKSLRWNSCEKGLALTTWID